MSKKWWHSNTKVKAFLPSGMVREWRRFQLVYSTNCGCSVLSSKSSNILQNLKLLWGFSFLINNPNAQKRASLIWLMKIKKSEICIVNYKLLTPPQCQKNSLCYLYRSPICPGYVPSIRCYPWTDFGLLIVTTRPYNFFQVRRGDITEVQWSMMFSVQARGQRRVLRRVLYP